MATSGNRSGWIRHPCRPLLIWIIQKKKELRRKRLHENRIKSHALAELRGWLTDRYGLAWQIVPERMMEFWNAEDPEKTKRMVDAMMGMVKLDIHALEQAFEGK